jgi:peptide/nickel transport system permease protein
LNARELFKHPFLRAKRTRLGLGIIVVMLTLVLLGPFFVTYPPQAATGLPNSPPSLKHIFGTDYLGHDLLSQVIYGGRPTLVVGLAAAAVSTSVGFVLGLFAGFYRRLEGIISITTDVILSIPGLILLVLLGSMFIATDQLVIGGLILVLWPTCARAVRSQVTALKKMAYVEAGRTSGLSNWQILWRLIAPEVGPIAFSFLVLNVSFAIIIATSIEFLGVGNVTQVSWGSILFYAQNYGFFMGDWWWILAPGAMIALTTSAFALIGFGAEELMNPRLRI